MPILYWVIVYSTMAILVGYVLYDIVISELITYRRLKRHTTYTKQRQEYFNNVLNVSNNYQSEVKDVKNVVIIKKSA
ncbi:hypothetical protein BFR45_00190 [Brochothrix thermosphacta]|uniref:hypothetical protein n=1 Tax=Brochothrix thermosphacta TaxID=2756 RepID=UPI00083F6A51|nr:hypothetical protein [Brochothrix thermosphacta]ODJ66044.1 hypothetical protein BFR36_07630 [Brochothrix thermosphacta]ODJ75546.1 hypothetical protein BFR45_00190 [Brochothrix thermosphacta]